MDFLLFYPVQLPASLSTEPSDEPTACPQTAIRGIPTASPSACSSVFLAASPKIGNGSGPTANKFLEALQRYHRVQGHMEMRHTLRLEGDGRRL
ncbi:hypothetical protein DPMN_062083 [Dreissena polymorpha]|uniref:Uncharacterized protein n=1 Tax=Dreissena polymorpha TaxID=45954 RepID=A0A9D4C8Z1_DREPO|nr:hypothetical protein DPMN_062083 [Dreissena polymorpha]